MNTSEQLDLRVKELIAIIEEQEELIKHQQDIINHQNNLLDKKQRENLKENTND